MGSEMCIRDRNSPQKRFNKKQGSEKPNQTGKNKPPNTTHQRMQCWTGTIQKLQGSKTNQPPTRRGKNRGPVKTMRVKHDQPHPTHTANQKQATRSINGIQPRHHQHTPQNRAHATRCTTRQANHTHATKVHWHTIEFSNNTSTPTPTHNTVSQHQVA